jgi:hypothetical protein
MGRYGKYLSAMTIHTWIVIYGCVSAASIQIATHNKRLCELSFHYMGSKKEVT